MAHPHTQRWMNAPLLVGRLTGEWPETATVFVIRFRIVRRRLSSRLYSLPVDWRRRCVIVYCSVVGPDVTGYLVNCVVCWRQFIRVPFTLFTCYKRTYRFLRSFAVWINRGKYFYYYILVINNKWNAWFIKNCKVRPCFVIHSITYIK